MIETEKKYKHLTKEDRQEIEDCLRSGISFKEIGKRIGKDQTTVSKEVKKHLTIVTPNGICGESPDPCPRLLKAPFVCNGCQKRRICRLTKHLYQAGPAHEAYLKTLVESREGLPLTKESFFRADEILTEGVRKGQHIYHISQTHNLGMSVSTVYRNIQKGYLSFQR